MNLAEEKRQIADVKGLEDQLRVAKRELEISRSELERRIEMRKNNVGSPDEVDRQQRATKSVELNMLRIENNLKLGKINKSRISSQIKSTRIDIKRAERDIERCTLIAPFSGVVESRKAQLGARVAPGAELYRLVDTSKSKCPSHCQRPTTAMLQSAPRSNSTLESTRPQSGPPTWHVSRR